jgi:hypothetical protein
VFRLGESRIVRAMSEPSHLSLSPLAQTILLKACPAQPDSLEPWDVHPSAGALELRSNDFWDRGREGGRGVLEESN